MLWQRRRKNSWKNTCGVKTFCARCDGVAVVKALVCPSRYYLLLMLRKPSILEIFTNMPRWSCLKLLPRNQLPFSHTSLLSIRAKVIDLGCNWLVTWDDKELKVLQIHKKYIPTVWQISRSFARRLKKARKANLSISWRLILSWASDGSVANLASSRARFTIAVVRIRWCWPTSCFGSVVGHVVDRT